MTQISPMLAVGDAPAAIEFYKAAFGAEERWRIDAGGSVVAGMVIDGAGFFLASANPPGTRGPDEVGGTTVRIELFVDDPMAVFEKAVAAGATGNAPILHTHETVDGSSFRNADNPIQYGEVHPSQGSGGGIFGGMGDPLVTVYATVDEIDAKLAKAKQLGGQVVMEKTAVPGGPTIAMFSDPAGNVTGMILRGTGGAA